MSVSEHANYLLNEYGRLQFDYAFLCKPDGESLRNEARNNLEEYIAELEAAQRWIPVSERLPEDRATILAAFKNREILTATYYKRYEGFGGVENYWHIEGWHSGNVTHWMPLPQPPEERER
jgi:hypothetical protein